MSHHDQADEVPPRKRRFLCTTSAAAVLVIGLVLGYAAFYWFSLSDATIVVINGISANRTVNYSHPWPGQTVFFAPAQWVDRQLRPGYWQWRVEHPQKLDLRSFIPPSDPP